MHVDRDTLVTDEGDPDPEAIDAAIDQLVDTKPHLAAARFSRSADGGSRGTPAPRRPSFGDVLRAERQ